MALGFQDPGLLWLAATVAARGPHLDDDDQVKLIRPQVLAGSGSL